MWDTVLIPRWFLFMDWLDATPSLDSVIAMAGLLAFCGAVASLYLIWIVCDCCIDHVSALWRSWRAVPLSAPGPESARRRVS